MRFADPIVFFPHPPDKGVIGLQLFPVIRIYCIDHKMVVQMIPIKMRCKHNLIFIVREQCFGKFLAALEAFVRRHFTRYKRLFEVIGVVSGGFLPVLPDNSEILRSA